jgi:hypothetical protein
MVKINTLLRSAIMLIVVDVCAYADISPTRFVGSGIAPKSESSIRMEKADVEIVWGTPCSLAATFMMVNPSMADQELTVSFPMPAGDEDEPPRKIPDALSISFDGQAAAVTPPGTGKEDRDERRNWVWYHCKHTFKPGKTEVVVKTILRASLVYATAFRESLFYCVQTGGNWAGNIGEEEVTIRFPEPLQKDQITSASPSAYQIDGNCVRWRFVDFKPAGREFDIALSYVRPDAMRVVVALRNDLRKNPTSATAAIKLAKHLLVLGNAKSNSGFPPSWLSKEQYDAILTKIGAPEDRKVFVEYYKMNREGRYAEANSEWTNARLDLVQILADAGYRDQASQSVFVLEAERLLKNVLARDPHNAEAWNVYLASYWRFYFSAVGHWFGMTRLSREQARLIETAAQNCPSDQCIRLWLDLRRSDPGKRDTTALFAAIKRRDFMHLDFPKIEYGYY